MPDRGRRRLRQLALALLALAAIWSVATVYSQRVAWILVVPVILSFMTGVRRAPPWLATLFPRVGHGVIALTILFGFLWTSSIVYEGPITRLGPMTAACSLVLGVLFILGTRVWNPSSAAVPLLLAAILSASFVPAKPLVAPFVLAGSALYLYGSVTLDTLANRAHQTRAMIGQILFVVAVAGLAVGTAFSLPWAQPYVEQMVFSRMASQGSTGFSVDGSLGSVEALSRSSRIVGRIVSERPQLLRLYVASRFDGRVWSHEPRARVPLLEIHTVPGAEGLDADWISGVWYGLPEEAPDQNWTSMRIISELTFDDRLLTPAGLRLVRSPKSSWQLDGGGVLRGIAPRILRTLSGSRQILFSDDSVEDCLAVPSDIEPRIVELAHSLMLKSGTTGARVAKTLWFLEKECRYSLDVGRFRTDEPLSEFLFEKKVGYCEYFATAAAVLLRLQDVPTRYVRGFAVSEWDRRGRHFIVRESNAHAWIDFWDAENGWIEVDPTPPDQYAGLHAKRVTWLSLAWERLTGEWAVFFARLTGGDIGARKRLIFRIFAFVVVPIVVVLLVRRMSCRRPHRSTVARLRCRPEIESLIALCDRRMRKSGWPRPATRTPLEQLSILPRGVVSSEWREAACEALRHIYAEVYGGRIVAPDMVQHLRRKLASRE